MNRRIGTLENGAEIDWDCSSGAILRDKAQCGLSGIDFIAAIAIARSSWPKALRMSSDALPAPGEVHDVRFVDMHSEDEANFLPVLDFVEAAFIRAEPEWWHWQECVSLECFRAKPWEMTLGRPEKSKLTTAPILEAALTPMLIAESPAFEPVSAPVKAKRGRSAKKPAAEETLLEPLVYVTPEERAAAIADPDCVDIPPIEPSSHFPKIAQWLKKPKASAPDELVQAFRDLSDAILTHCHGLSREIALIKALEARDAAMRPFDA